MTHYIVGNITIHDLDRYRQYEAGFMPILQNHGGKIVAVSDAPTPLEGSWGSGRLVILAFDTAEAAKGWMTSPEYREIAKHRLAASDATIVMAQGFG